MRLNSTVARYLWAPLTSAAAFGVRMLLHPLVQQQSFYAFYVAVALSARYGGLGPGLLATALGGLLAIFFFAPPHGADHQISLGLYVAVCGVLLFLHEEQRRERRRAEAGQRTLAALLEHIPEGIAIATPDARVQVVSRRGAEMIASTPEECVNLSPEEVAARWPMCHANDKTPAKWDELPIARAVRTGELITNEEWLLRRPDGASIPILTDAAPILDGKGRIAGGLTVWRDISHRKEIEDKLRETTKLESLGVLAGGVAHVFNNLLTSIIGYASMLIESAPEGSRNGDSARAILESAQTASALTRQMLAYSGRSRFVLERLNLSEVLDQMTQLLRAAAADMVDVRLDLAGDLPPVEADRAQLEQLVMDLLINAVEAIGGGAGRVSIVTRTVELDEAALRAMVGADRARPGRFVLLEFQDTGCGIDDGALPRIFDPFFTTKFTGRGLGLSAALGIVRGHAGGIKVHSAPGVGTTFRVYLPAA